MPGVPPKPAAERRRRNAPLANTRKLPSTGREGDTPPWPLSRPTTNEQKVWAEAWSTPQAVAWEELGWHRAVARYVRLAVQAEKPKASVSIAGEVRQLEDRLGLTPMAMLRLRWEVERKDETDSPIVVPVSRRLRAVDATGA